jgi:hypothetical protein
MNGKMIPGKPLYVAFAQRKEDTKAMLHVLSWNHMFQIVIISVDSEIELVEAH